MGFDFEPVKYRGIVARSNDNSAGEATTANLIGNVWSRRRPVHQQHAETVASQNVCGYTRELLREEADIIAYEYRVLVAPYCLEIFCGRLRRETDVLICERVRDDAAPSVSAEFDGYSHTPT